MNRVIITCKIWHWTALAATWLALAGCAAVLPTTDVKNPSKWATYDDAKKAFDMTVLNVTTDKDLAFLGFTPEGTPNVQIINYVDVVKSFGSSVKLGDMPVGVQKCFEARDNCRAYLVRVTNTKAKREGNLALDLFGFKKYTHTSGWQFEATLVLVNNVLVYKLWNGTPEIESYENQKTPLGPLQNLGGAIPKPW
jgi:hypothetical protein